VIGDLHGESGWAANAAECANEQGKFWEYHDKLADEGLTGQAVFNKANLKKYAAELGLDASKFNACVDSDKYLSIVQASSAEAQARGFPGTPTFLVNERVLQIRSLDFSEFARAFDALLR